MQTHTMTEIVNYSRCIALKRSLKILRGGMRLGGWGWGGGGGRLNRFYVATTFTLSSAVVYPRHLFNPRVGFLTHQCNIPENTKSNEYRDETRRGPDSKK